MLDKIIGEKIVKMWFQRYPQSGGVSANKFFMLSEDNVVYGFWMNVPMITMPTPDLLEKQFEFAIVSNANFCPASRVLAVKLLVKDLYCAEHNDYIILQFAWKNKEQDTLHMCEYDEYTAILSYQDGSFKKSHDLTSWAKYRDIGYGFDVTDITDGIMGISVDFSY